MLLIWSISICSHCRHILLLHSWSMKLREACRVESRDLPWLSQTFTLHFVLQNSSSLILRDALYKPVKESWWVFRANILQLLFQLMIPLLNVNWGDWRWRVRIGHHACLMTCTYLHHMLLGRLLLLLKDSSLVKGSEVKVIYVVFYLIRVYPLVIWSSFLLGIDHWDVLHVLILKKFLLEVPKSFLLWVDDKCSAHSLLRVWLEKRT